jgi:hypothetical protein
MQYAGWFFDRYEDTLKEDAPLVPGESQCRWCRAKNNCPALLKLTYDTVAKEFDDMTFEVKDTEGLSVEELAIVMERKALIISFLNAAESRALEMELNGMDVPGFKVVEGRSLRSWSDEEAVKYELDLMQYKTEEIYSMKLISPAQAEKLVGKKKFGRLNELVVKPPGKPTLVPDSDKRKAFNEDVEDLFDMLDM